MKNVILKRSLYLLYGNKSVLYKMGLLKIVLREQLYEHANVRLMKQYKTIKSPIREFVIKLLDIAVTESQSPNIENQLGELVIGHQSSK